MKHLLFIIILLSIGGCSHFHDEKPPLDLIPQDKMVQILVDIHVADALVEHKCGPTNPNLPLTDALYNRIYQNYNVTAAQYKKSYKYYESHPSQIDAIYTQVITELSKKEALLGKAK
jgi:hypothetical protein